MEIGFRMLRWLLEWSLDVIFKAEDDGHSARVRMYRPRSLTSVNDVIRCQKQRHD